MPEKAEITIHAHIETIWLVTCLPICSFAPGVCEMPVIQQHTDACICALYSIYWIVIYQYLDT